MREILFKAKTLNSGEWIEGCRLSCDVIIPKGIEFDVDEGYLNGLDGNHAYIVDPKTVCQYTGLKDKNGRKIFEGDIIKDDWRKCYKVIYNLKSCAFMAYCSNPPNEYDTGLYRMGEAWCDSIEVIGTIFDNPELLEVEE